MYCKKIIKIVWIFLILVLSYWNPPKISCNEMFSGIINNIINEISQTFTVKEYFIICFRMSEYSPTFIFLLLLIYVFFIFLFLEVL